MMARKLLILLLILFLPGFYFVSETIIDTSLLQLRLQLTREKLLNYELSSRVLQARFRQMLSGSDDFSSEIKMNVLESSVMNFDSLDSDSKITFRNRAGIFIVNVVRVLSLKSPLGIQEDQEKTLLLQSAFLMERDRHYKKASDFYSRLEKKLENTGDEDYGFVLLHNGYSLSIVGEREEGRRKLQSVAEKFGDSHYARTARMLLALLDEEKRRREKIESKYESDLDRAVALYRNGQYSAALEKFRQSTGLNLRHLYYRARCLEEVGEMKSAIPEYVSLASQNRDRSVAVDANRRLMMIGNFYRRDDRLSKAAEKNARALGDKEALQEVKEGSALKLEPVVVEKIKERARQREENGEEGEKDEKLEELMELQEELESTIQEESRAVETTTTELETVVEKKEEQEEKKENPPPRREIPVPLKNPRILVDLVDGRQLLSDSLAWDKNGSVYVNSGKFSITIPGTMIAGLRLVDESGKGDSEELRKRARIEFRLKENRLIEGYSMERYDTSYRILDLDDFEEVDHRDDIREAKALSGAR